MQRLAARLSKRVPTWTDLKKVRNLSSAKAYSTFVLFVPAAAILQTQVLSALLVPHQYLLLLYVGSLSFYLFTVLFDLACPRITKDYASRFRFVEGCIKEVAARWTYRGALETRLKAELDKATRSTATEAQVTTSDQEAVLASAMSLVDEEHLNTVWTDKDQSQLSLRIVGTTLLGLSAASTIVLSAWVVPKRLFDLWQSLVTI